MSEHPKATPFGQHAGRQDQNSKVAQTIVTVSSPEFTMAQDRFGRYVFKRFKSRARKKQKHTTGTKTGVNLSVSTNDTTPGDKQSVKEEIDLMLQAIFEEVLRRQKRKKKKVCKLPVDLAPNKENPNSGYGVFPQPASTTIESRMADCKSYAQLLNEYAQVETAQRAKTIVESVHQQRKENILTNMRYFLAREDQQLYEFLPIGDNSPTVRRIELDNKRQKKIKRGKKTKVDLTPVDTTKVITELHAFAAARKVAEGNGELKAVMKAWKNIRCGRNISEGFGAGLVALTSGIMKSAAHGIVKSAAKHAGINPSTITSLARHTIKAFRSNKSQKKKPTVSPVQKKYAQRLVRKTAPMRHRADNPIFKRPASGHLQYPDTGALKSWREKWQ
jgi:hypothetical protein